MLAVLVVNVRFVLCQLAVLALAVLALALALAFAVLGEVVPFFLCLCPSIFIGVLAVTIVTVARWGVQHGGLLQVFHAIPVVHVHMLVLVAHVHVLVVVIFWRRPTVQ